MPGGSTDRSRVRRCYLVCVTEKVCPAIVIVPFRWPLPLYRWMSTWAVPLPVPDDTEPSSIHGSFCSSVHLQPACVVTATFSVVASGPTVADDGAIAYVHGGGGGGGAAAWVTTTDWPATDRVPVRGEVDVEAATA